MIINQQFINALGYPPKVGQFYIFHVELIFHPNKNKKNINKMRQFVLQIKKMSMFAGIKFEWHIQKIKNDIYSITSSSFSYLQSGEQEMIYM